MAEQGASQYGGFWIRVLAYAVDGVILWIVTVGLIFACVFLGSAGAILAGILPLVLPLLYFVFLQASARQATFGKALLGMKVTSVAGDRISILRSLARELSKIVSAIPLAIGFLMAAFTGRKQGLHDLMASTVVPREGPSHVVAALAVVIVGYLGPVILVVFMGVGILAGVMSAMGGSMLGGIISEQPKEGMKTIPAPKPAPATPTAPAVATSADVDKLLVPLTGLDRPGSTRAGPAVLELSTFFGGSDPKVWVKVHTPLAVSRASVVVTQVADSANQGHYDPKNKFETEFFQGVQLSETRSGTPRMEGLRSVNLTAGTTEAQVQKIDGVLKLVVPVGMKTLGFRSADAGKDQAVGAVKLKLLSIKADSVELEVGSFRANMIQFRAFGAKGEPLAIQSTSWGGGNSVTAKFAGPVDKAEVDVAAEIAERSYPFTLARGPGAAPAPVVAVPVAPKPVPVVEKPAPPPAPVKVAEAPKPKPKPAPRQREAAPKPLAEPGTAVASAPAPAPAAAPAPKPAVQPKYGDLMTAAQNRDAAGIAELLEFGKWVDKPDRNGWTPLMASANLGDMASAERLLQAGADASKAVKVAQQRGDKAMLALLARYAATSPRPRP